MRAAVPTRRDRIRAQLADLKLPGALEAPDGVLAHVDSGTVSAPGGDRAVARRADRAAQQSTPASGHAAVASVRGEDPHRLRLFFPAFDQARADHELGFVEPKENVIFLGPPGVGKTHLAISWRSPRPSTGTGLLRNPHGPDRLPRGRANAAGRLTQRLKTLTHPALLVVDENSYLPTTPSGAMLFFQLMSRRYEHGSTVLTSNKSFEEWGEVFGDEVMAAALIDRLVHHCHIVSIRGNSFRMRQQRDLWRSLNPDEASEGAPNPRSPQEGGTRERMRLAPSGWDIFVRQKRDIFSRD